MHIFHQQGYPGRPQGDAPTLPPSIVGASPCGRPGSTAFAHFLLLSCLALTLFAACSGGGSGSGTVSHAPTGTAQPAQPITGKQITSGPVTYVALGASDAVGVGSNQPGSQGYVPLIESKLPAGSHLVNLGVSGIRLHEAMAQELPLALTTAPSLITIWLVVNDFVGGVPYNSYVTDLDSLLKQLRAGTKARIVMANVPDLTLLPAFSRASASQKATTLTAIKKWNAGIATIAARYSVTLVDLFSHNSQLTAHPEYISGDGFHPSPAGYVQLANYFWQGITA